MNTNLSRLGLALVLACAGLQAQAVGRLADVTVVDRNTGATLPVYYAKGEYWVAGAPGARYAIAIRNKMGERVMAVTSVDGINVLNGATASWGQTGYVFGAYYNYQITGWRKSNSEVAAFEFAAAGDSYAERTGRPHQVGVIGVALFKERVPEPIAIPTPPPMPYPYRQERDYKESRADNGAPPPAPPAAASPALQKSTGSAASTSNGAAAEAMADRNRASDTQQAQSIARPAMPSPKLGTGHGQREDSYVSQTSFERLQSQPNEVITIRYDSRENLIATGVIHERPGRTPNPFPNSDSFSYVPDPPARRY
ncbi:MAG: hypothetical protein V4858_17715 [Pseudomonadota bacterium]